MTVVTLHGLTSALGLAARLPVGQIVAVPYAGSRPYIRVDGAEVEFPREIAVDIINGDPLVLVDLVPLDVPYMVSVTDVAGNQVLTRYVMVPGSGPVDFEDLVDVDPMSYVPIDPTPTLVETIDQRVTEFLGDGIGQEVADYLQANPPSAGVTHTQGAASASWVIPHAFGRLPNVAVYVGGEQVDTDVTATASAVTVTFATPTAGVAVLN